MTVIGHEKRLLTLRSDASSRSETVTSVSGYGVVCSFATTNGACGVVAQLLAQHEEHRHQLRRELGLPPSDEPHWQIVENPTGSAWDLSDWRRTYETLLRLHREHCAEVSAAT
jgi:hypothetical protein